MANYLAPPPLKNDINEKTSLFNQVWSRWFSDFFDSFRKTQIIVFKQDTEPTISEKYNFILWHNSVDNKVYLCYKRVVGTVTTQVKVELS